MPRGARRRGELNFYFYSFFNLYLFSDFSHFFFSKKKKTPLLPPSPTQHALSLQSPEAKARALLTLRTVNGWSAEDARLYWRGREELAASRSSIEEEEQPTTEKGTKSPPPPASTSWRIDARWLVSRGVDLEQLSPAWRELLV